MQGGHKRRRAQGFHIGGKRPYGFAFEDDGKLVRLDHEQEAIRVMERMHWDGKTLRAIAAQLDARGIDPPSGTSWYPMTIRRANTETRLVLVRW